MDLGDFETEGQGFKVTIPPHSLEVLNGFAASVMLEFLRRSRLGRYEVGKSVAVDSSVIGSNQYTEHKHRNDDTEEVEIARAFALRKGNGLRSTTSVVLLLSACHFSGWLLRTGKQEIKDSNRLIPETTQHAVQFTFVAHEPEFHFCLRVHLKRILRISGCDAAPAVGTDEITVKAPHHSGLGLLPR